MPKRPNKLALYRKKKCIAVIAIKVCIDVYKKVWAPQKFNLYIFISNFVYIKNYLFRFAYNFCIVIFSEESYYGPL